MHNHLVDTLARWSASQLADQSYAYIPTKSLCGYPGASHALPFGAQSYANIDVKSLCGYPRRVKCHHFFELDCMQISIQKSLCGCIRRVKCMTVRAQFYVNIHTNSLCGYTRRVKCMTHFTYLRGIPLSTAVQRLLREEWYGRGIFQKMVPGCNVQLS